MTPLHELARRILAVDPAAEVKILEPKHPQGIWWLDLIVPGGFAEVEWKTGTTFGVTVTTPFLIDYLFDQKLDTLEEAFTGIKPILGGRP